MAGPVAYGIDFGTTNSAIAVAYDDGMTEVIGTPDELTESLIYLHRNANRLVGQDAIRAYLTTGNSRTMCSRCELVDWVKGEPITDCRTCKSGGACFDARLIAQAKGELASPDFHGTHSWSLDFEIEDLVSIVLSRMKKAADRELGTTIDRVTVGHPVRFAGAEGAGWRDRQGLGENRLRAAAQRAGFTEHVSLMAESKAAVAVDGVDDGILLCLDFGGGTFDVAVVDVHGNRSQVLALNGVSIGGEEFDAKMFDVFVAPTLGLDAEFTLPNGEKRRLPNELSGKLRSLSGVNDLMSKNLAAGVNGYLAGMGNDAVLRDISAIVTGGSSWPLFKAIKRAKHDLSTSDVATIDVRSAELTFAIPVTRSAFDAAIAQDLREVELCIEDALEDADVVPEDVRFVAKTGGSSLIPAFIALVDEQFPDAEHTQMDPFTSVVSGLARHAYEVWAS
ncbi:MAG: Hsp70 family protein [Actinomycetota bacterium]|jgi:hypothetical chaperone protein|nr:Hsp70 family protein [Actinomycetota bacterium]